MSAIKLNTSPTSTQAGRWVITGFGAPDVLEWQPMNLDEELPQQSALIRIIVAGVGGTDNIQRAGGYPHPSCHNPGFTPGYDIVGQVVSTSAEDSAIQAGDFVASMCRTGGHATHVVLPVSHLLKIRPDDDFVKVGALPLNYMTAYNMLLRNDLDLKPGSKILLGSAAGGVGTAAAQLNKSLGLGLTVYGTSSTSKFDFLRSLDVIPVDRRAEDFGDQVKRMSGGGVDVAFDAVGSELSLKQSKLATKDTGTIIMIGGMAEIAADGSGILSGDKSLSQAVFSRMQSRMRFYGVDNEDNFKPGSPFLSDLETIVQSVRDRKLDPLISDVLPLRDEISAQERVISGQGIMGRMVFAVDAELAAKYGI